MGLREIFETDAGDAASQAHMINTCGRALEAAETGRTASSDASEELKALFLTGTDTPPFIDQVDERFRIIYKGWLTTNRARIDRVVRKTE